MLVSRREAAEGANHLGLLQGEEIHAVHDGIHHQAGLLAIGRADLYQDLCRLGGPLGAASDHRHDGVRQAPVVAVVLHDEGGAHFGRGSAHEGKIHQHDITTRDAHGLRGSS